jgi:hypothetical protein
MLKRLRNSLRELFSQARDVRYISVPIWRPWRDYL